MVGDVLAVIMVAVRHDRIAVIGAALDQVDLVAALWPHLLLPQLPCPIEGDAEQVAMAERPDLRRHAALFGEGLVGRDAAVGVQADHLAQIFSHVRSEEHTSELPSLMRISYA